MVKHIIKYELVKGTADRSLIIIIILVGLLTAVALYNGFNWVNFQRENINKIKTVQARQHEDYIIHTQEYVAAKDTFGLDAPNHPIISYSSLRAYSVRNPSASALFSIGQSDLYLYYSMFTGVEDQTLLIEEEIQNPLNLLIGKLDLLNLILYLFPLIIIALSFDLLSVEKELGTIRLLLTQHLTLFTFVLSKVILRFLTVGGVVTFVTLAGFIIVEPSIFSLSALGDLGGFILISLLYILFWFALALLVNSFNLNSIVNGIILVGAYILFLYVIPTAINSAAKSSFPVPSREVQLIEGRIFHESIDRNIALKNFYEENPDYEKSFTNQNNLVVIDWYPSFLVWQSEMDRLKEPFEKRIQKQLLLQQKYCESFSFLSPPLLISKWVNNASGSSLYHQLDYELSLETYKKQWRDFLKKKIFKRESLSVNDFKNLPKFQYRQLHSQLEFKEQLVSILWLLALPFMILVASKLKYSKLVGDNDF